MSDLWSSLDLEEAATRSLTHGVGLRFGNTTITLPEPPAGEKGYVLVSGTGLGAKHIDRHWAAQPPTPPEENPQVPSTNSKTFKVVFTDGSERVIEANEVIEQNDRLKFVGAVDGHSNFSGTADVVASLLSETIAEYGVIPTSEEVRTGANTYRVTFVGTEGKTQDIVADRVMYTLGSEKGGGQYSLVTTLRGHETRTEFVISEDNVYTISRLTETGDVAATLPSPASELADTLSA